MGVCLLLLLERRAELGQLFLDSLWDTIPKLSEEVLQEEGRKEIIRYSEESKG